ncbi:MAG TPA: mannose-1-phosphate guanylyltransferase/mannose-6-phosphate isomerase, partial [Methylococcales bacterium]|nr:mannose-1-phosphate guanylyltransferase/mannose-6-phosphate isomerase [Methylococcales bacterium]
MKICPIILSGGAGTRLWPLSRTLFPKQFLNLVSEQSLFVETVSRISGLALETL